MTIYWHMICPFCSSKTNIYNSRGTHNNSQTWRRHRCKQCLRKFTTKERVDFDGIVNINSKEMQSPYSRDRLLLSLVRASNNLSLPSHSVSELCDTIETTLQQAGFFNSVLQDSNMITETTIRVLKRFNTNLALQYVNNVYRAQPPHELLKQLLEP